MNLPIDSLDPIRATIVPTPVTSKTVLTGKPINRAHRTVAGNMVMTCWKPNRIICPTGGVSFGRYPNTLAFVTMMHSLLFGLRRSKCCKIKMGSILQKNHNENLIDSFTSFQGGSPVSKKETERQ